MPKVPKIKVMAILPPSLSPSRPRLRRIFDREGIYIASPLSKIRLGVDGGGLPAFGGAGGDQGCVGVV